MRCVSNNVCEGLYVLSIIVDILYHTHQCVYMCVTLDDELIENVCVIVCNVFRCNKLY